MRKSQTDRHSTMSKKSGRLKKQAGARWNAERKMQERPSKKIGKFPKNEKVSEKCESFPKMRKFPRNEKVSQK